MTDHQVHWARKHDWFIAAHKLGVGEWAVTVKDNKASGSIEYFSDFQQLYVWAGY